MTSPHENAPESGAHEQSSPSGLCGFNGPLLAWIRKAAGWSRERFCRRVRWIYNKGEERVAGSSRQYQTYEGSMEVSPLLVQRYRGIIGDTLFDELWAKARKLFGALPPIHKRTSPPPLKRGKRHAPAHGF